MHIISKEKKYIVLFPEKRKKNKMKEKRREEISIFFSKLKKKIG